jgi:hypothetical protein
MIYALFFLILEIRSSVAGEFKRLNDRIWQLEQELTERVQEVEELKMRQDPFSNDGDAICNCDPNKDDLDKE